MAELSSDIKNRPYELQKIPNYGFLPTGQIEINLSPSIGDFLSHDIFDLDGIQPIEAKLYSFSKVFLDGIPVIEINPSKEALDFYKKRGDKFTMINIVVCCHSFKEHNDKIYGLPYHISLQPAQKRNKVDSVSIDWIKNFDLNRTMEGKPHYIGYNPFSNAFGLYAVGPMHTSENVFSDTIGFVYKTYFLASNYERKDVCSPGVCTSLLGENRKVISDYQKFRLSRYFKNFKDTKPIKIWGCDSPIELFLLQAMSFLNLDPKIQMHLFKDGSFFPSLHEMWKNGKKTKSLDSIITEADFFFPEQKTAVFCDSLSYHSSDAAKSKDLAIDNKLRDIGIRSIRLSGRDIVQSPISCAKRIADFL